MIEKTNNHFIVAFDEVLENVKNKEFLIENEINQIDKFISTDESFEKGDDGQPSYMKEKHSVFDSNEMGNFVFFNHIFKQYLLYGEYESILGNEIIGGDDEEGELILGDSLTEDEWTMNIVNEAVLFADYYTWLKSLKNKPVKLKPKSSLSHKQKMLSLYYLGLDLSKYDNTKTGNILGEILGLDKGNTRKYLSYVGGGKNNVRTLDNLKDVLNLFESQQLTVISNKIKKDIELLSK